MNAVDFGPQVEAVQAIIDRFDTLDSDERKRLVELRDDAFWAGWQVVHGGRADRAGLDAAQGALGVRLGVGWRDDGVTTYGAALAVLLRHTFTPEEWPHYEALTRPWVTVAGTPAHPLDAVITTAAQDTKIAEIHHEVQYNNGSSVKDAIKRVEPNLTAATSVTEEIGALSAAVDVIAPLDRDARQRVIGYLHDRFIAAVS